MSKKSSNKSKKQRKIKERQVREEIQNHRNKFIASIDRSIPDYPQISDWDVVPTPPFYFHEIDVSRCFYLTIIIKDSHGIEYTFGFDSSNRLIYAGKLFYPWEGMGFSDNRFAYITANSKLEREVFPAIESAIEDRDKNGELYGLPTFKQCLEKAKAHSQYWK
jgi:hypothetical protein